MTKPIIVPSQSDNKNMERYLHKKLADAAEGGVQSIKYTEQSLTAEQQAQARDNIGAEAKTLVESSQPSGGFLPNVFYALGELTGSVTFALAAPTDATTVNHYYWTFETGSTAPTITWPNGITWPGGSAPEISASKHYEISVLNGVGMFMEV